MNNTTYGTTYGTSHDRSDGKPMASQWLSQTQTQTHIPLSHLGHLDGRLPKPSRLGDAHVRLVLTDRIHDKIREDAETGCWLWTASLTHSRYGQVWNGTTMQRAHRLVYTLLVGDIPDHLECDHLCRVRHCVNPAHIDLVTHQENQRRRRKPSKAERKRQAFLEAAGWVEI